MALEGDLRIGDRGRLRRRFLAGATLIALMIGARPAAAQSPPLFQPPAPAPAAKPDDGLDQNSFYLEADTITEDDANKVSTAQGHVEVRYRGRTMRADNLTYDSRKQVVTAAGNVTIINPDGTAEFARELTLDKDLTEGVALGFSARLKGNVKLAAASLVRRNEDVADLNRAIYTPCSICSDSGKYKTPTWSISASKAVEDRKKHIVYYQNAVIRVLGVPVFYAPVFWNPDADATARSGFLAPFVQYSKRRGFSYQQPYLWVISPSQDLIVSPIFNTEVNPFLNLEWRTRFKNGAVNLRAGYTYDREFDNSGDPIPGSKLTSRGYVLANGAFDIDQNWKWGFAGERVTDDLLFDRYDIQGVYQRRGLFETDSRRLLSQVYAVREDQDSYLSISALDFQGLRIGDVNAQLPIVAPLIEGRFQPDQAILGGRLLLEGSAVVLTRDQQLGNPALPGTDSRRATAELHWRRVETLADGMRLEPFLDGRFDVYNVANITLNEPAKTTPRGIGTAGVDFSWPFIRQAGDTSIILEPLAQAAVSPRASPNPNIPNQDAVDFVFDETNLFDSDRPPGFDVYDSGVRFSVGGRATVNWGDGREARAFIGRSFRTQPDLLIPPISGYSGRSSDWIVAAETAPVRGLSLYGRTQLDSDTFAVRREEFGANFILPFIRGYVRYLHDHTDPAGTLNGIEGAGDVFFTKHWGAVAYLMRDLEKGVWARRDLGLAYQDDCTRIEVVYHHEAAFSRLGGPVDSVQVRLTLATLGEQGYRDDGVR
jgi:LPS-assembly protein